MRQSRAAITQPPSRRRRQRGCKRRRARLASDTALWQRIESNLDAIIEARAPLAKLDEARAEIIDLAPQLLAAAGNIASALPPADLTANQPYIQRLELMVESLQQNVRALGPAASVPDTVRRLEDAEQYLGQFVRGLRGEDDTLGVVAVRDQGQADVNGTRGAARTSAAGKRRDRLGCRALTTTLAAINELDAAAAELLTRYRDTDVSIAAVPDGGMAARLPLLLVFAALAIAARRNSRPR